MGEVEGEVEGVEKVEAEGRGEAGGVGSGLKVTGWSGKRVQGEGVGGVWGRSGWGGELSTRYTTTPKWRLRLAR